MNKCAPKEAIILDSIMRNEKATQDDLDKITKPKSNNWKIRNNEIMIRMLICLFILIYIFLYIIFDKDEMIG